jgi:hypothetical protein
MCGNQWPTCANQFEKWIQTCKAADQMWASVEVAARHKWTWDSSLSAHHRIRTKTDRLTIRNAVHRRRWPSAIQFFCHKGPHCPVNYQKWPLMNEICKSSVAAATPRVAPVAFSCGGRSCRRRPWKHVRWRCGVVGHAALLVEAGWRGACRHPPWWHLLAHPTRNTDGADGGYFYLWQRTD